MIVILEPGQQVEVHFIKKGKNGDPDVEYHKQVMLIRHNTNGIADAGVPVNGEAAPSLQVNLFDKEPEPLTKEEKYEALRRSVQTRSNRMVLFRPDTGSVLYVTNVRHNVHGQPTSGVVLNGGWRMQIRDGAVYSGRGREKLFDLPEFSIIYIAKERVRYNHGYESYEGILTWAEKLPKNLHICFMNVKNTKKGKKDANASCAA